MGILEHPTDLKELRSFLGCGMSSRGLNHFACVPPPLNTNLQRGQQQTFEGISEEKITTLETLKPKLTEAPVLALPRLQGNYNVDKEAGDKQIGCVPPQKQTAGTDRTIRYWYGLLNDA